MPVSPVLVQFGRLHPRLSGLGQRTGANKVRSVGAITKWSAGIIAALVVLIAGAAWAPASAQDADPYGSTTTTTASPRLAASCQLSLTSGNVGAEVTATVQNVPFGSTVRILLGGIEVGRATAPLQGQSSGAPVIFNGAALPAAAATTTVAVPFVVPAVAAGDYLVTAVGVDFTCSCTEGTSGFKVLGGGLPRVGGTQTQNVSGNDSSRGLGALPRTGIYVALLLAIAAALLLVGRALLEASRRRQAAADDAARSSASHLAPSDSSRRSVLK
jgi:hypothetical protein